MNIFDEKPPETSREPLTRDYVGGPDALEPGRGLTIFQHQHGYRFGLDALLLATDLQRFGLGGAARAAGSRPLVVELGAAQGVVSLCIARQFPHVDVLALERQAGLSQLLKRNIQVN